VPASQAQHDAAEDDINLLHQSLRGGKAAAALAGGAAGGGGGGGGEGSSAEAAQELHRTVETLFEEEEALLNLHMNVIQENAEVRTVRCAHSQPNQPPPHATAVAPAASVVRRAPNQPNQPPQPPRAAAIVVRAAPLFGAG
jgi:hypothetical protein